MLQLIHRDENGILRGRYSGSAAHDMLDALTNYAKLTPYKTDTFEGFAWVIQKAMTLKYPRYGEYVLEVSFWEGEKLIQTSKGNTEA